MGDIYMACVCVCASGTCCEMTEPSLKKAVFIFRHVTSIEKDKKITGSHKGSEPQIFCSRSPMVYH